MNTPLPFEIARYLWGGGGGGAGSSIAGGAGGGVVWMEVAGTLTWGASGLVTASGSAGTGAGAGGGGGGLVQIGYIGTPSGTPNISVVGGSPGSSAGTGANGLSILIQVG